MRYFIDTEFIEDGITIDLISIGIVAEDGREYYAQVADFNPTRANQWVQEHVFPHLIECTGCDSLEIHSFSGSCAWRVKRQIKEEIQVFLDPEQYGKPEMWGWCAGYDFVAFCQPFGTMMDLPSGYPHYIREFQQVLDDRDISDEELPEQEEGLHNALADARHLKRLWGYIICNDAWQ